MTNIETMQSDNIDAQKDEFIESQKNFQEDYNPLRKKYFEMIGNPETKYLKPRDIADKLVSNEFLDKETEKLQKDPDKLRRFLKYLFTKELTDES